MMGRLWNELCAAVGDATLGWLLYLPRDVALVLLAALTAIFLMLIRRFVSNQRRLQGAVQDNRRLRRLIRRARRQGDRERVARYRRTRSSVARVRIAAEVWPALLALLPLSIVVTWAAGRLPHYPPDGGTPVKLTAYTPITAVGEVVHLVPHPALQVQDGWMRAIEAGERHGRRRGLAAWQLTCPPPPIELQLQIRLGADTIQHPLRVGHRTYAPPVHVHVSDDLVTEVTLTPYRPFGWLPDTGWLPAWTMAYLVLTAAFFFLGKLVFRVA